MKQFLLGMLAVWFVWAFADGEPSSPASLPEVEQVQFLIDQESYVEAVNLLKIYLGREESNADYHNLMGYSLRKLTNYEDSLKHYLRALELEPEHLGANEYLGELYVTLGQLDKAKEHLAILASAEACRALCEQYQDLAKVIAEYKTQ